MNYTGFISPHIVVMTLSRKLDHQNILKGEARQKFKTLAECGGGILAQVLINRAHQTPSKVF